LGFDVIVDHRALLNIREDWDGVQQMKRRMQSLVVVTFATGAITAPALAKVVYNLPLLLSCDVLGRVLRQLRREGQFDSKRGELGPMIDAAKSQLPWLDWEGIRQGSLRRNEVAHGGVLHESDVCIADIARIEEQLVEWKVI
jgi:hypothetical protein